MFVPSDKSNALSVVLLLVTVCLTTSKVDGTSITYSVDMQLLEHVPINTSGVSVSIYGASGWEYGQPTCNTSISMTNPNVTVAICPFKFNPIPNGEKTVEDAVFGRRTCRLPREGNRLKTDFVICGPCEDPDNVHLVKLGTYARNEIEEVRMQGPCAAAKCMMFMRFDEQAYSSCLFYAAIQWNGTLLQVGTRAYLRFELWNKNPFVAPQPAPRPDIIPTVTQAPKGTAPYRSYDISIAVALISVFVFRM